MIEGKNEEPSEEHDIISHFKPICAAIYNDLFDQVIHITCFTVQCNVGSNCASLLTNNARNECVVNER